MVKCQACLKSGKLTLGCRLSAGISCSLLVGVAGEGLVAKSFTLLLQPQAYRPLKKLFIKKLFILITILQGERS